jgi:hypothetical protein
MQVRVRHNFQRASITYYTMLPMLAAGSLSVPPSVSIVSIAYSTMHTDEHSSSSNLVAWLGRAGRGRAPGGGRARRARRSTWPAPAPHSAGGAATQRVHRGDPG